MLQSLTTHFLLKSLEKSPSFFEASFGMGGGVAFTWLLTFFLSWSRA